MGVYGSSVVNIIGTSNDFPNCKIFSLEEISSALSKEKKWTDSGEFLSGLNILHSISFEGGDLETH